jgi:hypothetical protein
MTTDLNILAFNVTTGAYVPGSSFTTNNIANNRPVEMGTAFGVGGQLQFVIARSSVPTAPRPATRVRLGTDSNSASANIKQSVIHGHEEVTGQGPQGNLRADEFHADRGTAILTLSGHVQMTLIGAKK